MEFRRSLGVSSDPSAARRSSCWVVLKAGTCFQLIILLLSVGSSEAGRGLKQAAAHSKEIRLQAYTDSSNTPMHGPAVKSFQVSDGSWIDCVPIEQQIAAHHPALKDHVIRMETSSSLYLNLLEDFVQPRPSELHPQRFAREHGGCPEGSIPVQRTTDPDNSQQQRRKQRRPRNTKHIDPADPTILSHQYAVAITPTSVGAFTGSGAVFSVNGPVIGDPSSEFSLSQLWIAAGEGNSGNTVEVGWQTYPGLHPSDNPLAPHLFVYWTSDGYQSTGCYNLACPGFVQTSNTWVLGGTFSPYTTLAENENYEDELSIVVIFDSTIPGWSLSIENTTVGYWPSSIYTTLQSRADFLEWGGEIAPSTIPTNTSMGSGAFPSAGYPMAAYQREVTYYDSSFNSNNVQGLDLSVTNANCYNISFDQGGISDWGSYFFFGGPGGLNPACVA